MIIDPINTGSSETSRIFQAGQDGVEILDSNKHSEQELQAVQDSLTSESADAEIATAAPTPPEPGPEDMSWDELWSKVNNLQNDLDLKEFSLRSTMSRASKEKTAKTLTDERGPKSYLYKGNDLDVLKQRLQRLSKWREERILERMERDFRPDFWTSIRYRKNTMRIAERQSTRAMIHWFGPASHRRIVDLHLERYRDENEDLNVIYSSNWSRSFHGLQEAFGY